MTATQPIIAFWFRRDLRFDDNRGLYKALETGKPVLPVFIFDREILDDLQDIDDVRITFIHQEVSGLHGALRKKGSGLYAIHAKPLNAWKKILEEYPNIEAVYTNRDYEPYAKQRDGRISDLLGDHGVAFKTFKDQVIFERNEVLTNNDDPYTVFTPYSKKWLDTLTPGDLAIHADGMKYDNWLKMEDQQFPSLERMGFKKSSIEIPNKRVSDELLKNYAKNRDIPAKNGTSRMSHHLRFGTVSIRKLAKHAWDLGADAYLNELIWREFYMQILDHYPKVVDTAFREKYDRVPWKNDKEDFERWCKGKTGIPMVDAGMRQLNKTAYMHNRVRMIVASFLTKNLLIDWRWGEAYFAQKLLDFELSSNNGGWQWAAGSGTDAAPYFRVFNPITQQKKFDPDNEYVKKWIPEINTEEYPEPMVDVKASRKRAIETYKKAIN